MDRTAFRFAVLVTSLLALSCASGTQSKPDRKMPKESHDGLVLQEHTKMRAVYLKPGATLDQYDKIALLDCFVSFKKNWRRDYNEETVGLERRISTSDMEKIKKRVANEFKRVFTEELERKGGYPIVDSAAEDVLVVRPAIINLVVTAPDNMDAGMDTSYVASAGQMTLYMELYDSVTSDIIARVIDPEADREGVGFVEANRVTNTAAEDQIMRRWADALRSHLGHIKDANSSAAGSAPKS